MKKLFIAFLFFLGAIVGSAQIPPPNAILNASDAGTCSTAGACFSVPVSANVATAVFTVSGTFSGTIQFESSGNVAATWTSLSCTPVAGGAAVTSITGVGSWTCTVSALTNIRARMSTFSSGAAMVTITMSSPVPVIGGGGSGGGTANPPGTAGAFPQFALYTVYMNSGTVYARNNSTGAIDYSGTDAAPVINGILTNNRSTCGTVYFKNGDYPLNSVTLESNATALLLSGSLYYAVGIQANAGSTNQYCQWHFEGEQASYAMSVVQTQGVIFDVTAAALTAAGAGNMVAAFWHRPDSNNIGNDVFFKNIAIRFPDATRGNECAFCMYEAGTVDFENTLATIKVSTGPPITPTISAPVGGTNRMIGYVTTQSGRNAWEYFQQTWATGYDIGYDIESEHSVIVDITATLCNYFGYYGRIVAGASIGETSVWDKITDESNIRGLQFGGNVAQGSLINISGYGIEFLNSGAFARVSNFTELNNGYSGGVISYSYILEGGGFQRVANLFSSGGTGFNVIDPTPPYDPNNFPVSDAFTRPNATSCGPVWQNVSGSNCTIVSNNASSNGVTHGTNDIFVPTKAFFSDQFAKATVNNVTANNIAGVTVRESSTGNFYRYVCSTSGGFRPARAIQITTAINTVTTLLATPANSGCNTNGDTMELDAIGNTLIAFYNGVVDLVTTDSTYTTGDPGILTGWSSGSEATIGNFLGGNLPTKTGGGSDSMYHVPEFAPTYNTLSNCNPGSSVSPAACGSAPSGTVVVPTTTATYTVNTTAVTLNSRILIHAITDNSGLTGAPTCTAPPTPFVAFESARVAGTSFTFTLPSTTGASCWTYNIVN